MYEQLYVGDPTLDELVERLVANFDQVERDGALESWSMLAEASLDIMWELHLRFSVPEFLQLVVRKQHDYGHENILKFGVHGVVVRTWDKIARLQNLLNRGSNGANEPIFDTLIDIVGYSVIGIMLEQGWFTLPLEADLEAL